MSLFENLKVGDEVLLEGLASKNVAIIKRITATMIIVTIDASGYEYRFNKNTGHEVRGNAGFYASRIKILSPEIKKVINESAEKLELTLWIKNVCGKLSLDELRTMKQVYEAVNADN
jgi:hypothetical protein